MASADQVRGALLEETILWLLEFAGYRTVITAAEDPTLLMGPAGLSVRGRGATHQIDAIADFEFGQPFSFPQRLLIEAKAYGDGRTVGMHQVRNAVGVVKDVSEYWVPGGGTTPPRRRYHYTYALFSLSPFSLAAQRYAFAQDIFLVPLARSQYFAPVGTALGPAVDGLPRKARNQVEFPISLIRSRFRDSLRGGLFPVGLPERWESLTPLVNAIRLVGSGLLGTAAREFPLFLVPRDPSLLETLPVTIQVRIRRQAGTWYLESATSGDRLFSFDLPQELFELYADNGILTRERALDLKGESLAEIHAFYTRDGQKRLVVFRLDQQWLEEIRQQPAP